MKRYALMMVLYALMLCRPASAQAEDTFATGEVGTEATTSLQDLLGVNVLVQNTPEATTDPGQLEMMLFGEMYVLMRDTPFAFAEVVTFEPLPAETEIVIELPPAIEPIIEREQQKPAAAPKKMTRVTRPTQTNRHVGPTRLIKRVAEKPRLARAVPDLDRAVIQNKKPSLAVANDITSMSVTENRTPRHNQDQIMLFVTRSDKPVQPRVNVGISVPGVSQNRVQRHAQNGLGGDQQKRRQDRFSPDSPDYVAIVIIVIGSCCIAGIIWHLWIYDFRPRYRKHAMSVAKRRRRQAIATQVFVAGGVVVDLTKTFAKGSMQPLPALVRPDGTWAQGANEPGAINFELANQAGRRPQRE